MATEANGAAQEAPALNAAPATPSGNPAPEPKTPGPASSTPAPAAAEPKKLTNAQLKAQQKAEKAARRAQAKEAKAAFAPQPPTAGPSADAGGKGSRSAKTGNKQEEQQQQQQGRPGVAPRRPSMGGRRGSVGGIMEKDPRSAIPECFSHIPMAKRIPTSQAHKDVHPAVLALGQQMATFTIRDSVARLKYMLLAFKKVQSQVQGHTPLCVLLIPEFTR
jgi:translation initiation factor eIF-2B subunit delta